MKIAINEIAITEAYTEFLIFIFLNFLAFSYFYFPQKNSILADCQRFIEIDSNLKKPN